MGERDGAGAAWDAEYGAGRYREEPPVAFTRTCAFTCSVPPSWTALLGAGFEPVMPLRLRHMRRTAPQSGQWSQWEAIWRKAGDSHS